MLFEKICNIITFVDLKSKTKKAKEVIKKTSKKWKPEHVAIAWTGGKDSTVVLDIARKVFDGEVPFKVIFNDSTLEFPEIYDFIEKITKKWKLKLITIKHSKEDLKKYKKAVGIQKQMEIMRLAKINAINVTLDKYNFKALVSGIRWDEHRARSKEKYFSSRANHMRVHPILQFNFDDIWKYIHQNNVPYVDLYDKGYKSLGETIFTTPVNADGHERDGREATKEKVMYKLRRLGYW